ncbi:MAG: hypothetical protein CVU39_17755 [Chloroflexi bacterium HGW-Chloroflexi-10]|nr:MAG: hypothetical protein CVU39_17755 [Chloroflexi bacterium HGW-Chloroflexi-10]
MKQFTKLSEKNILILIILFSIIFRIAAAIYMGNKVVELPGTADQITYHTLAQRILNGHGFTFDRPWWPATQPGEPTAHWSYLYTFFLTAIYRLFGVVPLAARIIQAILIGFLQPVLIYLIAKKIFDSSTALIAATWMAAYVYFIYYTAALLTEPLFITSVLAIIYFTLKIREEKSANFSMYFYLGLMCGTAVLLRQAFLLFLPFLFLWILWLKRKPHFIKDFLKLSVSGLIILACILPFTWFNYIRFERFVLLNTNAGFAFYWANHPVYGTQFEGILPEEMGNYLILLPEELKGLDEAALDQALLQRGLQFVQEEPGRYFLLSLSRIPILFEFLPSKQSSLISNFSRVASFGIALPFILIGIMLSLVHLHRKKQPLFDSSIFIILLFGLVYCSIHILSWTLVRYRLPVDALFLIFAAYAIRNLSQKIFTNRISGR